MLSEKERKEKSRLGLTASMYEKSSIILGCPGACCHTDRVVLYRWCCEDRVVCFVGMHTASFAKQLATSASIGSRCCVLSYTQGGATQVVLLYRLGGVLGGHADSELCKAICSRCQHWQQDHGLHQALGLA